MCCFKTTMSFSRDMYCIVCKTPFRTCREKTFRCPRCRKDKKIDLSKTPKITTFFKVIKKG